MRLDGDRKDGVLGRHRGDVERACTDRERCLGRIGEQLSADTMGADRSTDIEMEKL